MNRLHDIVSGRHRVLSNIEGALWIETLHNDIELYDCMRDPTYHPYVPRIYREHCKHGV